MGPLGCDRHGEFPPHFRLARSAVNHVSAVGPQCRRLAIFGRTRVRTRRRHIAEAYTLFHCAPRRLLRRRCGRVRPPGCRRSWGVVRRVRRRFERFAGRAEQQVARLHEPGEGPAAAFDPEFVVGRDAQFAAAGQRQPQHRRHDPAMHVANVPDLRRGVSGVVLMARDDGVAGRDLLDRHAAGGGFDDRARD